MALRVRGAFWFAWLVSNAVLAPTGRVAYAETAKASREAVKQTRPCTDY